MELKLENVSFKYSDDVNNEVVALKNVNLTIKEGQFIGIIGHTGSGKSTLVQHLNGLVKATEGAVYCDGKNIYDKGFDIIAHRCRVGLVFQYPEHQLFESTVLKDVCFGPKNKGMTETEAENLARKALLEVGIPEELFLKSPFELSGGQKRKVAIAGVLAMEPEILILDEPTAGLDPVGRDRILALISKLKTERNITVILVSHSMEDVAKYVERLVVMNHGTVMYDASPKEVFRHYREMEKVGLSAPMITYIVNELADRGMPINRDIINLSEAAGQIAELIGIDKIIGDV